MSTLRSYRDGCATARALDLVGERWALLVVRELLLGPKRFTDLRAGLPGIGPNVLAQRLRELEQAEVVDRTTLPPPAASQVYELTDWGRELEGVVLALGRWASRSPSPPTDLPRGADSLLLALRGRFDPALAGDLAAAYELQLGRDRFRVTIAGGVLEIERGGGAVDGAIRTDPATFEALLWKGARLKDQLRAGTVTVDGERRAARRFLKLFPLAPAPEAPAQPSSARATSA